MNELQGMKVCLVWQRYGPYHRARLNAAADFFERNGGRVVGVEIASQGGLHDWQQETPGRAELITLFPERSVECLSRRQVYRSMRSLLDQVDPTAVAVPAYSAPESHAALAWARDRRRVAVVMADSTRDDAVRSPLRERAKRAIVSQFDAALAAGTPQLRYICDLGIPQERVFKPYDVVDSDFFASHAAAVRSNPAPYEHLPGLGSTTPFFLASGRFIERKNFEALTVAYRDYRLLDRTGEPWNLVILGDGPRRPQLAAIADAFVPSGAITLPGYRQLDEAAAYYGLAGAFVHPATIEPWGLVINEAMAAGLPVLASISVGATEDLVTDGVTGFTFDPHNRQSMTAALQRISAPDTDRLGMGENSIERIASWSPECFAGGLWRAVASGVRPRSSRLPPGVRLLLWGNTVIPRRALAWRSVEP
jgi:glycosyltransferase involved in cell wall biosynthesis